MFASDTELQNPGNFLSDKNHNSVLIYITNPLKHTWVYINEVTFGKPLKMLLVARGPPCDWRTGTFSPTLLTSRELRGTGGWMIACEWLTSEDRRKQHIVCPFPISYPVHPFHLVILELYPFILNGNLVSKIFFRVLWAALTNQWNLR